MLLLSYFFLLLCLLVGVAFYTLLERSILGYIQIRKGPNSVGVLGLLQPFGDGVKLMVKEQIWPFYANSMLFYLSPVVGLLISFLYWSLYLMPVYGFFLGQGVIWFLIISSLGVYSILGGGWSSNSMYGLLGCYRAVAQTISYEVGLALILLGVSLLVSGFSLFLFIELDAKFLVFLGIFLVWITCCLAETNRSPFDFAEGESELVSGFNIEYGGGGFALIFIGEYANMIFMSLVSVYVFLWFGGLNVIFLVSLMILLLWVRGSFPRYRYDRLMMLAWKSFLPVVIGWYIFMFGLVMVF